jgi:ferrous iron transport protein B
MEKNITVALAGNPNSGKTTVFNNMTGARQHVGNWPGVTVEKKEGSCKYQDAEMRVVDLPGTYSLTAYSLEEVIARDFVVEEKPDVVVDIVDASNLERNLYLATQFMELGANLVIALNMMDVAESRGMAIDTDTLSELLGVPVVPMIATKKKGTQELLEAVVKAAEIGSSEDGRRQVNYGREVEGELTKIEGVLEFLKDDVLKEKYSPRWIALKLLEGDEKVTEEVSKAENGNRIIDDAHKSAKHIEAIFGDDTESVIVDRRYGFISGAGAEVIHRTAEERHTRSDRIDQVLTNRLLGIPIFLFLMWLTFQLTFKVGAYPMDWIDAAVGWLSETLNARMAETWYRSLLVDGIIGGVGGVLIFLPNIFILFFVISILEDSGYMARAAFIMDRVMHKLGLHGKSFIPMLMGFGCNVPAIMATRTLESRRDRILTILLNPLMSCSARLPVYTLLTAAFFSQRAGTVIFSLYILGIVLAVLMGKLFRKFLFPGPTAPFVMELPPYRTPTLKGTLIHMWERGSMFLRKAGTIILAGAIIVWSLGTFPWGVEYASEASYAGKLGHIIEPVVKPFGADWRGGVALFFGFVAKEIVVGTFGVLYGTGEDEEALTTKLQTAMTPPAAYAFMVVTLIYVPCLATVAAIKKETASWKWTFFAVGYGLALAWVLATLIYQIGGLLGLG